MLEAARSFLSQASDGKQRAFRFHHISTDEVYGDLEDPRDLREDNSYAPSSPIQHRKPGLITSVRAWGRTFGLPILTTNCSNNYGPFHFPEKLIPLVILNALRGKPLPVYGKGNQVRDWLFVEDHARALVEVATRGVAGETANIGGHNEKQNIDVVKTVCRLLDEMHPSEYANIHRYEDLITFVEDRPGHDVRYAIDASKIERELGWRPQETLRVVLGRRWSGTQIMKLGGKQCWMAPIRASA